MEPPILTTKLTKRYGAVTALDELDLAVEPGEVFGFLGPNGAGKTTTIRILMGFARPTAGTARVLGLDASREAIEVHKRVAFVPAETAVWPQLRGSEILELLGRMHGSFDAARRDELCQRFELDPTKRGREYSRGNRQKLGIVAAFMTRAEVFLLDEPATGLDPLMAMAFRSVVREAVDDGATVFLSSHVLAEVEALCDRVAILRAGRIIELEALDKLKHRGMVHVEVAFDGPMPDELGSLAGVHDIAGSGELTTFAFDGDLPALLALLGRHATRRVEVRSPTLEELFLRYYGEP